MSMTEHTVTIGRPIEEIWDYLMDNRNDEVWITNVVEVGRGADVPPALGVEVDQTVKFLGVKVPVTLTVTGTRLTISMETDAHGFFKLAEPVFARMVRRDMVASCENLKDILEANGSRNDSRTDGP